MCQKEDMQTDVNSVNEQTNDTVREGSRDSKSHNHAYSHRQTMYEAAATSDLKNNDKSN